MVKAIGYVKKQNDFQISLKKIKKKAMKIPHLQSFYINKSTFG